MDISTLSSFQDAMKVREDLMLPEIKKEIEFYLSERGINLHTTNEAELLISLSIRVCSISCKDIFFLFLLNILYFYFYLFVYFNIDINEAPCSGSEQKLHRTKFTGYLG